MYFTVYVFNLLQRYTICIIPPNIFYKKLHFRAKKLFFIAD